MHGIWTDVRYGARRLANRPGFLSVSVITLALGIGANVAIYSVVDALMLRPLPYARPIVHLHSVQSGGFMVPSLRFDAFLEWGRHPEVFARVEAYSPGSHTLSGGGEPNHVASAALTGGLMEMIGVTAQLGRTLQTSDSLPGRSQVVVIADSLWRTQFGAQPDVLGRRVQLDDQSFEIVGVMGPQFRFPYGQRQLWIPLVPQAAKPGERGVRFETIAVLQPGVTLEQAQSRIDATTAALTTERPMPGGWDTRVRPFQERRLNRPVERALYVLFGAVALILLIACANIASLLLVQGAGREREVAVRAALGAGRGRLVRQFLTETALLAVGGGVVGIWLALWGVDLLARMAPAAMTFLAVSEIAVDRRGLAFAVALTILTALIFGILPALRGSRVAPDESIKSAARTATGSPRHRRIRNAFVVAQLALSMVLLVAGGLLARTFVGLTRLDPGFQPDGLVAIDIALPRWKYATVPSRQQFYQSTTERLRTLPGVRAVTIAGGMPPDGGSIRFGMRFEIDGRGIVLDDPNLVMPFAEVDSDYFDVLGIPLLAGRSFSSGDTLSNPPVVIINDSMARRFWGDPRSAVGQRLRTDSTDKWETVVGVTGDVFQFDHSKPRGTFAVYYPLRQQSTLAGQQTVIVRMDPSVKTSFDAIRQQVWSVDPAQPIQQIATAADLYDEFFATPRFYATLMVVFACVGASIAAVGLYGMLSYSVAQRTREFGIRLALGARRADVLRLALGHGMGLALAGIGLGLFGSMFAGRALRSMLVDLSPGDPVTYAVVVLTLGFVAGVASWVPGRRAAGVDPATALRQE